MDHTIYTHPSGFDPSTVSTAADQLRVFERAMRFALFRQIVSMASVTLPVAGTVTNYNPLIADGYAGKTGSDSAADGCVAFFTHLTVGGRQLTAVGVVIGQGQRHVGDPGCRGRGRHAAGRVLPRRSACESSLRQPRRAAHVETLAAIATRCCPLPVAPRHGLEVNAPNYL